MTGVSALAGLRVLDLSEGVAGPYCTRLLGDFGASVVKVEPPHGDWTRGVGPFPGDVPHRETSARFLHLNTNKRGIALDLDAPADRGVLGDLAARADVLVESFGHGTPGRSRLDAERLAEKHPRLVVVSVTPFGLTGPYRDHPATDFTITAMSGLLLATGEPDREPLTGAGPRASYVTGYMAYLATLAALRARRRTGRGQQVDISALESTAAILENFTTMSAYTGEDWRRVGDRRTVFHPASIYRCRDGYVQLYPIREEQWQRFCRVIGRPDLATDPRYAMNVDRVPRADEIDRELAPWLAERTKAEIERVCQAERIPVAMVADPADLATSPHLAARSFWARATHPVAGTLTYPGAPFRLPLTPWRLERTAPLLGAESVETVLLAWSDGEREPATVAPCESTRAIARSADAGIADESRPLVPPRDATGVSDERRRAAARGAGSDAPRNDVAIAVDVVMKGAAGIAADDRPLAGLRVLDLSAAWAGPLCTRILAYLGAEVVKIEGPDRVDVWRGPVRPKGFTERYPGREHGQRPWNRNAYFNTQNHGKHVCALDLTHPRGLALARRLAALSDVVVENYSARVMAKLGLDFPVLRALNPRIILLSMPGFGLRGPARDYVAWGPTIEAASGMCHLIGYRDGPPVTTGMAFNDPLSGLAGCAALLTALAHRDRTGEGQHVELSQQEAAVALLGDTMLDHGMNGRVGARAGNRHPVWAPQGAYACVGHDRWIALSVTDEPQWLALCACLGREDWAQDPVLASATGRRAQHEALDAGIAAWTRELDRDEAWSRLRAAGVPAGPALTATELNRDPHLRHRGFFTVFDHPDCGRHPYPGLGLRLSATPGRADWVSPPFGAHNDHVFRELLGLGDAEVAELHALGVTSREPRGAGPTEAR
jgi:crotonobetainyl-CoA:carnitine CoA-transferase CaiB-like acyl-CoA transferase